MHDDLFSHSAFRRLQLLDKCNSYFFNIVSDMLNKYDDGIL
jgi:hypothetical protein